MGGYIIPFSEMCFMYKCQEMHSLYKMGSSFSHMRHNWKRKTLNPISLSKEGETKMSLFWSIGRC